MRSKVSEDEESARQRMEIVREKSPVELAQIHSFAEIPVPRMIENWLHSDEGKK